MRALLTLCLTVFFLPVMASPEASGRMDIQDLYELSLQKQTLAKTLESLPDVFKTQFTLVYNSPSMQASSFQHPRAILFNEDASLAITFNGNPEHRGYNHLEAAQFLREEARWEFYDISFEGAHPQLSEPNPSTCLACHQYPSRASADPRPNWEPYNVWPTLYGSLGGTLEPQTLNNEDNYYSAAKLTNIESQMPGFLSDQNQEAAQLVCFIKRQVMGLKDDCAPDSHDSSDRYGVLRLDLQNKNSRINAGLHDLSRHMAENNFLRVLRLMKKEPYYESVKFALGAFLLSQLNLRQLTTKNQSPAMDYTSPSCVAPLSEDNMARLLKVHERWRQSMGGYYGALSATDLLLDRDRLNLTRFIDLLFGPQVGPEFMDWSLDFRTGGKYLHNNQRRFRASGNAAAAFAHVFFTDEPEMSTLSCDEIAAEANDRLSEAFRLGLLESL